MAWQWLHRFGSPRWFYEKTTPWVYILGFLFLLPLTIGLVWGLAFTPAHHEQGNSFRIIYLHVPVAILAMVGYYVMAIAAAIGFIWRIKLSFVVMRSAAVIGAVFTFLALFTGSLWGKPAWGTWWEWDARIVTVLILLLLYLGVIALHGAFANRQMANKVCAILAIVGTVNIPIIYFSVDWWYTLHQPASLKFRFTFSGVDTINYTISDGKGGTASAQVFVQVDTDRKPDNVDAQTTSELAPDSTNNRAPIANNDGPLFTSEGTLLTNIDVLANDFDPDGDPLTLSVQPETNFKGVVAVDKDTNTLTYLPYKSPIHKSMLAPLLFMIVTFYIGYAWLLLLRVRAGILYEERRTQWVRQRLLKGEQT